MNNCFKFLNAIKLLQYITSNVLPKNRQPGMICEKNVYEKTL